MSVRECLPDSSLLISTEATPLRVEAFQQAAFQPSPTFEQIDLEERPQVPGGSNFTSVLSSFSSILKLGTNQDQLSEEAPVPLPAGLDAIIDNNPLQPTEVQPVPLFPLSGTEVYTPKPATTIPSGGPVNSFRRTGPRKAVYAPVPGLSGCPLAAPPVVPNFPQAPALHHSPQSYFKPPAVSDLRSQVHHSPFSTGATNSALLPEFTPPPTVSPGLPANPTPPSYFKPISPQPPTFSSTTLLTPTSTSQGLFGQEASTPVMAAMSASEMNVSPIMSPHPHQTNSVHLSQPNQVYRPVYHHWFCKKETEGKSIWQPFSMVDSLALEHAFTSNDLDPEKFVATDGGRYDVNILRRERVPVYWTENPSEVRRCSWFHKGNSNGRYVPYEENIAAKLEEEFKIAFERNEWQRKVELSNGESVMFHSADVLVLFPPTQSPDGWGNTPNQMRPRIVKRGMDEFDIDEGEPAKVDHLLFMVHGIGSVCDLRFRNVHEVVHDFRSIALQLVQSHYKSSCEKGTANRIEVLPISWHADLHNEDTGIDRKLKSITLESIPRLRDFTNDTILDVLFYTSPIYCQTVVSAVGNHLNRIYELFKKRNPDFTGGVSLGAHSLGSLILFDLLGHQHPESTPTEGDEVIPSAFEGPKPSPQHRKMSRQISYILGTVGTGQPQIQYPQLNFKPKTFFALGSPAAMFVTVRGLDTLGEEFAFPTCPGFFNIFHPYDPVAYRMESLINPDLANLKPVLIPHHKGRKRMHLELKETMARVGADLKQRVVDSMKNTWNSLFQLTMFHRPDQQPSLEEEVDKAFREQVGEEYEEEQEETTDLPLGKLNSNRRIDYVLQEAPHEFFNEYIFALSSHVCYWESQDTILMILKEIYTGLNIAADDKIPQQSMTIERPPPSPKSSRSSSTLSVSQPVFGIDPTAPIQSSTSLGPPPIKGFVKKT